jgi:small-conductance mechanosensitive channel
LLREIDFREFIAYFYTLKEAKMNTTDYSEKIAVIANDVRVLSFDEKKEIPTGEEIDRLLDAVIESKKFIQAKISRTDQLTQALETITWMNNPSEQDLLEINQLISSARDLRLTLLKTYSVLNNFIQQKNVLAAEVNDLKRALDDFTETIDDVESVFFFLPRDKEFKETSDLLFDC